MLLLSCIWKCPDPVWNMMGISCDISPVSVLIQIQLHSNRPPKAEDVALNMTTCT
jgi:hypothetical protein